MSDRSSLFEAIFGKGGCYDLSDELRSRIADRALVMMKIVSDGVKQADQVSVTQNSPLRTTIE